MGIHGENNLNQFKTRLATSQNFLLSTDEAYEIFELQNSVIEQNLHCVWDEAKLIEVDRNLFWGRQFLNSFSIE